jgi:hypothetical protein
MTNVSELHSVQSRLRSGAAPTSAQASRIATGVTTQRRTRAAGQAEATISVPAPSSVVTRQLGDEHLLYLLFIAPERDAAGYRGVLNAMVGSMQIDTQHRH